MIFMIDKALPRKSWGGCVFICGTLTNQDSIMAIAGKNSQLQKSIPKASRNPERGETCLDTGTGKEAISKPAEPSGRKTMLRGDIWGYRRMGASRIQI